MERGDFDKRLLGHLSKLYGDQLADELLPRLHGLINHHIEERQGKRLEIPRWD